MRNAATNTAVGAVGAAVRAPLVRRWCTTCTLLRRPENSTRSMMDMMQYRASLKDEAQTLFPFFSYLPVLVFVVFERSICGLSTCLYVEVNMFISSCFFVLCSCFAVQFILMLFPL